MRLRGELRHSSCLAPSAGEAAACCWRPGRTAACAGSTEGGEWARHAARWAKWRPAREGRCCSQRLPAGSGGAPSRASTAQPGSISGSISARLLQRVAQCCNVKLPRCWHAASWRLLIAACCVCCLWRMPVMSRQHHVPSRAPLACYVNAVTSPHTHKHTRQRPRNNRCCGSQLPLAHAPQHALLLLVL